MIGVDQLADQAWTKLRATRWSCSSAGAITMNMRETRYREAAGTDQLPGSKQVMLKRPGPAKKK